MEFRQLTYFLAAAHTQNFRQAADLCLVTQPALSRQIAALEKELGMLLFRRVKQHVQLTSAGQAFVAYAREALDILQQGELELARWQKGESGAVHIGCNHSLAAAFLPPLLASFRQLNPAVQLLVHVDQSDKVIKMVERGEVDLGFIYDPMVRSELVVVKELFHEPLQLLVPSDHPLALLQSQERTLERIAAEPLLLMGSNMRLRKVVEQLFRQRGLTVRPVIETDSIAGLVELVKQGCGVTLIMPALLWSAQSHATLSLCPIADVTETFIFALIYRRIGSLSVPARQFITTVVQATTQPAP